MSSDESGVTRERIFEETCSLARHYSALRWAMYAVFVTITGGLATVESSAINLSHEKAITEGPPTLFRLACFVIMLGFLAALWRLSSLVRIYNEKLYHLEPSFKPDGHELWRYAAYITTFLPFILSALAWLWGAFFHVGRPLW
jgi:hypothetical protein